MMTNQENMPWLDDLEKALRMESRPVYQRGAAMTMMRKIRLELARDEHQTEDLESLEITHTDIVDCKNAYGHQLATYKDVAKSEEVPVLVETMHYDSAWEKIPPRERAIAMGDKARGFGVQPKPQDLRILDCLGFFEEKGENRAGYSFVYQAPARRLSRMLPTPSHEYTLTTLLALLMASAKLTRNDPDKSHVSQPLLGDKFRLASMLANNLFAFHSIGWYHENYHSNNVVFFDASHFSSDNDGLVSSSSSSRNLVINPDQSKILLKPYVMGLNKSRPGGQAWHTQGPALDTDFGDYQHPDYRQKTKHYRNSYDYYTLGVVLLEIGLWTPLKAWAQGGLKGVNRTLDPYQLRDLLLLRYVPRLAPRMGQSYHDAVKVLLSDVLDPSTAAEMPDPVDENATFSSFFDLVVQPLSSLADASI